MVLYYQSATAAQLFFPVIVRVARLLVRTIIFSQDLLFGSLLIVPYE